jgi:RHS repeat-associated protein
VRPSANDDYANNRYYSNAYGRFMTVDAHQTTASASNPQSWNLYAYTNGDPVNGNDPRGTDSCVSSQGWTTDDQGDIIPIFYDDCQYDDYLDYSGSLNPSEVMMCMSDPVCYSSQMVNGGGGSPSLPASVQQLMAWANNTAARLQAAIALAINTLATNPLCDSLFGLTPGSPDPVDLLQDLKSATSGYGYFELNLLPIGNGLATNAQTSGLGSFNNAYGGSFSGAAVTINMYPSAPFNTGSAQDDAITVLHELGHVYMDVFGAGSTKIQNDIGNTAASKANTQLVKNDCFGHKRRH